MMLDESKVEKITELIKGKMHKIFEENITDIENIEGIEKLHKGEKSVT